MTDSEVKLCGNGHRLTPQNLKPRPDRPGQFRCQECLIQSRRNMSADRRKRGCMHGVTPASACVECQYALAYKSALGESEEPPTYGEFAKDKAQPLDYLRPSEEQAAALAAMDFAVDKKGRPLCETPQFRKTGTGKTTQYFPHMDWVKDKGETSHAPSAVESMKMCMGCPVLEECDTLRKAFGYDGTWAGVSYLNGEPVN